ncbi:M20 metallopeptidase family protein [Neobacillus kokaensis]|uniref:N-acyl-L-amino acid amidohydrolase n=1 Tax=Neobacillus kokaensis TaxID=2759023 RepID=A0ABQ3N6B1_9BACI|nr:amidohydrolase [Neobacillus kokaensis]GHH99601.1 N-acyl-L-amino acid amidohydrolase [Neobacillus kokaensis]
MQSVITESLRELAVRHRRHLHQHPELSWQEFETSKYIKKCLQELNIEILNYTEPSVIGYLRGTKGAKTIALRADIDALPIQEEGERSYLSTVPGVSHACGHDGHTAILLAAARWFAENRNLIKPNVLFIFQTSEEMLPSGAEALVNEGVLDEADAVFGLHLFQSLEKGKIGISYGSIMAAADDFTIKIEGKGGHGAMPQDTVDPTHIASHIILALQSIISRRRNPLEPAVISVGKMEAGMAYNVIPDTAVLGGTIRTITKEMRSFICSEMEKLVEGLCQTFGAKGSVEFGWGAPPVINEEEMSRVVEKVAASMFGQERIEHVDPNMGSEDFSYYLEKQKGAYFLIGMGGEKSQYPHHHPKFDIDEEVLGTAIECYIQLVMHFE